VQSQDVGALLKQYDVMSPLLKAMSGKGVGGRMQMLQELQQSGMFTQGGQSFKVKKDTGKRLTPKERAEMQKRREKELRRKKREEKDRKNAPKDSSNPRG
jgi:signal recognition particle subunit SRP54